MMTSAFHQPTQSSTPAATDAKITPITTSAEPADSIQSDVLFIGKKTALDYIAPALFRINRFGELVVKAKGAMSIVTAVNVAEMIRKDVTGLETRSVSIGTEEIAIQDMIKRVSFIEIRLARPIASQVNAPPNADHDSIDEKESYNGDRLAETAKASKKIRAKAKKATTSSSEAKTASNRKRKKRNASPEQKKDEQQKQ